MDAISTLVTSAPLAVFMLILAWIGKGRFDSLERQIVELRSEVRADIAALRSDLLHVALARRETD